MVFFLRSLRGMPPERGGERGVMDLFLTGVGAIMLASLIWIAIGEWQKAGRERKLFLIDTLVAAAQQIHGHAPGAERYKWVAERVAERFPGIDHDELMELIEAAVYRLKHLAGRPNNDAGADTRGAQYLWRNN